MNNNVFNIRKGERINALLPLNAERDVVFASEELIRFLERATLSQVVFYDFTIVEQGVISIGNTELLAKKGLKADFAEVGKEGYKIKTLDGSLYIYAATPKGVLNGVYGFFEHHFHSFRNGV